MSVSLDGTTQYLTKSITESLPFSFACWFNSTSAATNQVLVAEYTASANSAVMDVNAGNVRAFVSSGTTATSSTSYSANTWNHACATFASGGSAVYLNGGGKGTGTVTSIGSPTATYIGSKLGTGIFFSGQIAFAAIWNVQLSDVEAAALGGGADPRRVRPQALIEVVPLVFSGAVGFSYISSTAWTLGASPGLGASNPSMYMARNSVVPFFSIQNAAITFSPVVTLTLGGTNGQSAQQPIPIFSSGIGVSRIGVTPVG